MENFSIDLKNLKKSGLSLEIFIILQMLSEEINPADFNWQLNLSENLQQLEADDYIKILEDSTEPRQKLLDLFQENSKINFDEFWDIFPTQTRSGRPLRSASKEFAGKPTRDYATCKKKYLSKVKTPELHTQIITILKARISTSDIEYMNNMETYINQRKWEVDSKYLSIQRRTNKVLNE